MPAIDIHFHIVPRPFLDALRRGDLRVIVEVTTLADRDGLIFHAPPHIVIEPNLAIRRRQYDEATLLASLTAQNLNAGADTPPPEFFLNWAPPELGELIARTMNDGMAALCTHVGA